MEQITMTYIWIGVLFLIGWLLGYLFVRQIAFDFATAYPTLNKMKAAKEDLIVYKNAKRYTTVSVVTCILVLALFSVVCLILKFLSLWMKIAFFAGIVVVALMIIGKMGPENKKMFEAFCNSYYRFIPDDQLRTDMYNNKYPAMKLRCHDMGVSTDWIPEFKKED